MSTNNVITTSHISTSTVGDVCDNISSTSVVSGSIIGNSYPDINSQYLRYWKDPNIITNDITVSNVGSASIEKNEKGKKKEKRYLPKIEKVIFNDPVTVVMWSDNTKTIVKCMEGTEFDKWTGLSMAITKKALGDDYHHTFRKHCIKMVDTYDNDSVSTKENHKESIVKNKKDTKKTEEVKKEVKNEKVNKKNRSERPKSSFMKKVKGSKSYKEKKAED